MRTSCSKNIEKEFMLQLCNTNCMILYTVFTVHLSPALVFDPGVNLGTRSDNRFDLI